MGVCFCKDKVEAEVQTSPQIAHQNAQPVPNNHNPNRNSNRNSLTSREFQWLSCADHNLKLLSESVDKLVKETLDVIGKVVDNQPEPPYSMQLLHTITDKPTGWIELVRSLIRVVPVEHPMGTSVIALLLDDSPLPSKESIQEVSNMIASKTRRVSPRRERNLCAILGCLAEKLAGPTSITMLSPTTLKYLIDNLSEDVNRDVTLLSLVALDKFALTSENKITIRRKLSEHSDNPMIHLEKFVDDDDFILRQIGFCARWCLDNYFFVENRKYSYETVDLSKINVMLNTNDVSEYLKISPDGLEARCDAYTFESVRCTFQITSGCWYYEVLIITPGVMQIGWATKDSHFLSTDGFGIGDDDYSIAFDGCRRLIWQNAKSVEHELPEWHGGSILGCMLDLDNQEVIFSLNGMQTKPYKEVFKKAKTGFFAAASFMSFQQCRFNFGSEPFKYPPKRSYQNFNNNATLAPQDKIVLPRHLFLEKLRRISIRDDSCTLCFDKKAIIRLEPCKHRGFCSSCATQLNYCPMCRADIATKVQEDYDSPIIEDLNGT